jgi:hypothetical protein
MLDIKKLITGFLIIAVAASSAALILSNLANRPGSGSAALVADNSETLNDQNAYVPTQQDVINAITGTNSNVVQALADPKNLTANYTDAFLNGLVAANPDGFQTDDSGNVQLQAPDANALVAQIQSNPNLKKISIPDWNAEVNAQKLNISNAATVSGYNNAVGDVFNKNFIQSGAQSLVGQQDLDPSNFAAIASPLQSAVTDAAQTATPTELAGFQKSLVAMLVYEKNMVALGTLAQTDPVKAAITYQAKQQEYLQVLGNFGAELQKASSNGLISFKAPAGSSQNAAMAFLQTYLGIPTAHAFLGFGDITFDPAVFAQFVLQTVNEVILQILKNTLVAFIQQRVLGWIQNSGAPRFVQQFANQLVNIAQAKAISAVAQILPGYKYTCPNIGNLLGPTIASLNLTVPAGKQPPQCTLPAVSVSQLKNFYNNFNYNVNAAPGDSWKLYAQVLNPNNNYFGVLMQSQDYVSQQVDQAQQAQQAKTQAGQGFKGQEVCDDGSDPNGLSPMCVNDDGDPFDIIPLDSDGWCPDNYSQEMMPNNGLCSDGSEPYTTTPGQTTKQVTDQALGGALDLTVNANSIAGVLASVATSLLNTIVEAGVTAATQYGTQGLTSITLSATAGGASSNGGVMPTTPTPPTGGPTLPPTQCFVAKSSGATSTFSLSATGGNGVDFNWSVSADKLKTNGGDKVYVLSGMACSIVGYEGCIGLLKPSAATGSGAILSLSFDLIPPAQMQPKADNDDNTDAFPVTFPVTVTGSDGTSDTCSVVVTQ